MLKNSCRLVQYSFSIPVFWFSIFRFRFIYFAWSLHRISEFHSL